MSKRNWLDGSFLYVAIIIYIIAGFSTLIAGDQLADMLFDEDKYFENMGAIGFFVTSLVFLYGFIKTLKLKSAGVYFYFRLAILFGLFFLFFFGGGEEISWGQRIFNIQTPESLSKINTQDETNVHNIGLFENKIHFETIFDMFWVSLTLALPLVVKFNKTIGAFLDKFFSTPRIYIGLLFLFNYLWAKVATILFKSQYGFELLPFVQAVQEVKESNYALLFVLVAIDMIRDRSRV